MYGLALRRSAGAPEAGGCVLVKRVGLRIPNRSLWLSRTVPGLLAKNTSRYLLDRSGDARGAAEGARVGTGVRKCNTRSGTASLMGPLQHYYSEDRKYSRRTVGSACAQRREHRQC